MRAAPKMVLERWGWWSLSRRRVSVPALQRFDRRFAHAGLV